MIQKALGWLVFACVIVWAVAHPETAAGIVGALGHAVGVFFSALSS